MAKVDLNSAAMLNASFVPGMKQDTKKTEGKTLRQSHKNIFSTLLERSGAAFGELGPIREFAPSEEALIELMDAVHSAGSDLIDRPFTEEIMRYKQAVRDFLHYVVENSYTVEKTQTRRRELRNLKPHVQIQVIDRKLDELAAAILSGQTNQLQRVAQINEIKGLLVDLTISGAITER